MMRFLTFAALFCAALTLSACQGIESKAEYPTSRFPGDSDATYGERQGIFGKGGLNLFSSNKKDKESAASSITVNAYLWRAALDTVSFMPIDKADPFGGTILTEWYSAPNNQTERVKANIYIMDRNLRSDAVKVSLFRQIAEAGRWVDVPVDAETTTGIEETILTRARQLKAGEKVAQ